MSFEVALIEKNVALIMSGRVEREPVFLWVMLKRAACDYAVPERERETVLTPFPLV